MMKTGWIVAAVIAVLVVFGGCDREAEPTAPCNDATLAVYEAGGLTDSEFARRCPHLYRSADRAARWQD